MIIQKVLFLMCPIVPIVVLYLYLYLCPTVSIVVLNLYLYLCPTVFPIAIGMVLNFVFVFVSSYYYGLVFGRVLF